MKILWAVQVAEGSNPFFVSTDDSFFNRASRIFNPWYLDKAKAILAGLKGDKGIHEVEYGKNYYYAFIFSDKRTIVVFDQQIE